MFKVGVNDGETEGDGERTRANSRQFALRCIKLTTDTANNCFLYLAHFIMNTEDHEIFAVDMLVHAEIWRGPKGICSGRRL